MGAAYASLVKTMQVGELKARFSEVVELVKNGEEIVISYGKKHENVAVILPYSTYRQRNRIGLGVLKETANAVFSDDYKMTPSELVSE